MSLTRTNIVVTGTDTGIGKTTVSRGLLRALVNRQHRVRPLKWLETGCNTPGDEPPRGEDAIALSRAARRENEIALIGPIQFRLPAAPVVAARAEGRTITDEQLAAALEHAERDVDAVLIEGAGGALVPISETRLFADACIDLAHSRDFILVTRDGLGTIHHTLATYEALVRREVNVLAVVVNQRSVAEANDGSQSVEQLRHWLGQHAVLGPIPPFESPTDDQLAAAVEATGLVERVQRLLDRRTCAATCPSKASGCRTPECP
jgi:dethiobiotin synthetase